MSVETPVALIVFNRPDHTRRLMQELAKVRPTKILIIADGPRNDDEQSACEEVREIATEIDWQCTVLRNYSAHNLGCRGRISSGIDWVFSQFEQAIFIEDDCLPHPTFFSFVEEMLERYRDTDRVRAISGDNFQFGTRFTPYSYYFSLIPHCWGWATWRRAWKFFDVQMREWPAAEASDFPKELVPSEKAIRHKRKMFSEAYAGKVDSWAIPWEFSNWRTGGLAVLPAVNLVTNIGFGPDATHCREPDPCAELPAEAMEFPLRHPPTVEHQLDADLAFYERTVKAAEPPPC